ncbi:hypothetical protein C2845_PM05G11040 [Panicum miliaceum]|uniref:Uncharacterized protein n=1 Tax=Panicum miliaceum TaxID=4540 RepID=A0A3L6SV47_PANMI|nr:hypothetical protein C2845_PM05G11040 [Panicum miliaceum]
MESLIGSGSAARLGCQRECQIVRSMAAWHPSEPPGARSTKVADTRQGLHGQINYAGPDREGKRAHAGGQPVASGQRTHWP